MLAVQIANPGAMGVIICLDGGLHPLSAFATVSFEGGRLAGVLVK